MQRIGHSSFHTVSVNIIAIIHIPASNYMKVYIKTHGCQMNEYDSGRMIELLEISHGAIPVDTPEEADVLLLNTCSIREKAQEKVFHQLGRWRYLKERRPDLIIAVGGCVASQEGTGITTRAPFVDVVFGPQTLHRLPELIDESRRSGAHQIDISFPEMEKFDQLPMPHASGPSAYVSVMEGCSKYCTFCVVPYTRGPEVSRPVSGVMKEVSQLAEQGVREINFLGQNVNAFHGELDGNSADLAELLFYASKIEGIERLRFTTSHPVEFSDSLINAYAEIPELASHVHLPVQSGSDRILTMMKRGHTVLDYKSKIKRLRDARPDITISSDFIVGFPGETKQDFEQTMDLIRDIDYDVSFSFIYSARPGTPAAAIDDTTPFEEKKDRLLQLQKQLQLQVGRHARRMVRSVQCVLVTGPSKRTLGHMQGRTENNRVVNFAGPISDDFVNVVIDEALSNSLRGHICS